MHQDWLLLLGAGTLGGAMNALAGGGSFVTLPALIGVGVPAVAANASSTVALYPGGAASAWIYRGAAPARLGGVPMRPLLLATLAGGLVGALLLLTTPATVFDRVLPWLLLLAAGAIAAGPRLGGWLRRRVRAGPRTVLGCQFLLGVYGGYFGGAVGLMMLALWSLLETADLAALQAPRTLLVTAANSVAVVCFVLAGVVHWRQALPLAAGALAGGVAGAWVGRRLRPGVVRGLTILVTLAVTGHFFYRAYGHG